MNNLDTEMIVLNKAFASKEEAIRFCDQKLVDAGCVDWDYVEAMYHVIACYQCIWGILSRFPMVPMQPRST